MATSAYISGRKRYQRPQSILWSENAGTLIDGLYVPTGQEIGANSSLTTGGINQFLILSDHNREEMSFNSERIERRERTINGRMRSYHIADKLTMSVSWNNLPSRAYSQSSDFGSTGLSPNKGTSSEFTADGGAGGVEVLDWYEKHQGPFWMYLAYDKYSNFSVDGIKTNESFANLGKYNQIVEVYFSDFNYSVVKRGGTNHDLWNISVSLEEV
jgi:hypothetical protein